MKENLFDVAVEAVEEATLENLETEQQNIADGGEIPFFAAFEPDLAPDQPLFIENWAENMFDQAIFDGLAFPGQQYAANDMQTAVDMPVDEGVQAEEVQTEASGAPASYRWLAGLGLGAAVIGGIAAAGGSSGSDDTSDGHNNAGMQARQAPADTEVPPTAGETPVPQADSNAAGNTNNATDTILHPFDGAGAIEEVPVENIPTNNTVTEISSQPGSNVNSAGQAQNNEKVDTQPPASDNVPDTTVPTTKPDGTTTTAQAGNSSGNTAAQGTDSGGGNNAAQGENGNTLDKASQKQEIDLATTKTATVTTSAFVSSNVPSGSSYKVVKNAGEAAKVAASDSSLKHIVVSDGSHHTLFTKDAGGDYTTEWGSSSWGATFKDSVSVSAFHTGSGDITSALQSAVNMAAKKGLGVEMPENGSFVLSGKGIVVPLGTDFIHGNNSTLVYKGINNVVKSGVILAKNIEDFEIDGFTFDLQNADGVRGIVGINSNNVTIEDNNFVNVKNRAISIVTEDGNVENLVIKDNNIVLQEGTASDANQNYGIVLYNQSEASLFSGSLTKWHEYREGGVTENKYAITNATITGNNITGGYYGVSFSGVTNSTISNNMISENVRNISIQNRSDGNKVTGNYLADGKSSAVHIAYSSNNNTVSNNTVVSDQAKGQGLLQAYQGSTNNKFTHNEVNVLSDIGTGWMLYTGTDSNGTVFSHNTLNGLANRKVIGVESIWDSDSSKDVIGAYMPRPLTLYDVILKKNYVTDYNGGTGDLDNVTITDNIIASDTAKTTSVLFMGAETSSGLYDNENLVGDINNLKFVGNKIVGGNYEQLVETHTNGAAAINGFVNSQNSEFKGSTQHYSGSDIDNVYFVDTGSDTVKESADGGNDTIYATVDYTLSNNVENLVLLNTDNINGTGNALNNIIKGNAADNVLDGGSGHDTLIGGAGSDTLTGGVGEDTFKFEGRLNGEVDKVTDFTSGHDKLALGQLVFGNLEGNWFAQAGAETAETRVIQDGSKLFYDADGSGKYFAQVQFADLGEHSAELTTSNFTIY